MSIRSVPSGTAVDYISTKNHVPDGYMPSNAQWDYILSAKGVQSTEITDRLFGNTSGLLMKDKSSMTILNQNMVLLILMQ